MTQDTSTVASGAPKGKLEQGPGQWIKRDTIAWKIAPGTGEPSRSTTARQDRSCREDGVSGDRHSAHVRPAGLPDSVLTNYPQLTGYSTFKLPARRGRGGGAESQSRVGQGRAGELLDARARDTRGPRHLYTYNGPLARPQRPV